MGNSLETPARCQRKISLTERNRRWFSVRICCANRRVNTPHDASAENQRRVQTETTRGARNEARKTYVPTERFPQESARKRRQQAIRQTMTARCEQHPVLSVSEARRRENFEYKRQPALVQLQLSMMISAKIRGRFFLTLVDWPILLGIAA
jgi:hypothetical protein